MFIVCFRFLTVDNEPPRITCPPPKSVPVTCSPRIEFSAATSYDACGAVPVHYKSGNLIFTEFVENNTVVAEFHMSRTTVTATSTNQSGQNATCQFDIIRAEGR